MAKINTDDMREVWLNEPELTDTSDQPEEFPPFAPREVKEQLLEWWGMGWDAKKIFLHMGRIHNGFFICMTPSTVERWKRVILAHDRRLTGGKVLSELGNC